MRVEPCNLCTGLYSLTDEEFQSNEEILILFIKDIHFKWGNFQR